MKTRKRTLFRLASGVALPGLLLAALPAGASPFLNNSPLSIAREYHTATLLSSGKVLVAGGYNGSSIAISELYDPTTGTSATNAALTTSRYQHTATLLPNGKVLVTGGLQTVSGGGHISQNATASAELYDPVANTWTATGSMSTARFAHTANLLTNGLVLVAGGEITNGVGTNGAELYNPTTGTWTPTGPMGTARFFDTATLLPDGTVLVAGGAQPLSSAELYDPVAGTWSATGSMTTNRTGHTATLLQNGLVVAAGGYNSAFSMASAEIYNPTTKVWTATGSLTSPHFEHTATLLPGGKVLVTAGDYGGTALIVTNKAEAFDPVAGTWSVVGQMNVARAWHTATQLPGGQVVIMGGYNGTAYLSSVETYESTNGSWSALNPMSALRYSHTLTLLTNGQVLAAGGASSGASPTNTELYNPLTGTWTNTIGPLNFARANHTATLLSSGKVLVAGGYNSGGYYSSAELYDPASQLWTVTSNYMSNTREYHTATLLNNGQVLVAGGYNGAGSLAGTETYNPSTGMWTTNAPLNTARAQHTATMLPNGKVLVAGGYGTGFTYLNNVETYDPATGAWTTNAPMKVARAAHSATLLPSGKVLVAGGYNSSNFWQSSAELFDPVAGTWTLTGPMSYSRENHVAKLLVNGQVLVAGGSGDAVTFGFSEVYEPSTGVWAQVGPLITARSESAAAIIHNGWVLVSGGYGPSSPLSSAEAFLDFGTNDLPVIGSGNSSFISLSNALNFSGTLFRGVSEGSGGNGSQDSAADYPLVQLLGLESGQSRFLTITNWTTNSLISVPLTNFPYGWALATVMVNGTPSQYKLIDVVEPTATVTLSGLAQYYDGTAKSVTVTTVPSGLAVNVTYNGSSAAPTNVGSYTVVALVNSTNYIGGATNTLVISLPPRNFGVDSSHFQNSNGIPLANWQEMFTGGNRFVFQKASEGLTGPDDPTMSENVSNATAAGLLAGVYHYGHPENRPTTNGAVQEADHFLIYAGSLIGAGYLRPVLDIETGYGTLTASQMTDWVLAFSQEIVSNRGAGAAPIVYCTQFYANEEFDSRLVNNALWVEATGSGDPTYTGPPTNCFPSATGVFTNWAFWQYNLSGTAGGVSPIDLDVCHDEFVPLSSYLIPTAMTSFRFQTTTLDGGGFHLSFTNVPGTHFTLVSSTNAALALSNWTVVGAVTEVSPGQFQVTDGQATNFPHRYYRVRSP